MKILVCIDDTDNLDSKGTGEILEDMFREMEHMGLARGGFVTRHQLLIDERIEYTSHNSSMCCEAETEDLSGTIAFARAYLQDNCAEGSDPGLCVLRFHKENSYEALKEFGKKAQTVVLTKEDAIAVSGKYPDEIFLSEHGGTGDGIIGALAGVGLRLTGEDGKVKGKIAPETEGEIIKASEFCRKYSVDRVISKSGQELNGDAEIRFLYKTKANLMDNKVTVSAEPCDGYWVPCQHKGGGRNR